MARIEPALGPLVAEGLTATDDGVRGRRRGTPDDRFAGQVGRLPGRPARPPAAATRTVTVSGIAKGVGMIHPRMATMLSYVLTDADVSPADLSRMLRPIVARTWDQLSVDGDTSTSDTVFLVASGASGAARVTPGSASWPRLAAAVEAVCRSLARQQAADGEGATSLLTCQVTGRRGRCGRACRRSCGRVQQPVQGRGPRPRPQLGTHRRRARQCPAGGCGGAGGAPASPRTTRLRRGGSRLDLDPARVRIAIAGIDVFAGTPLDFDAAAASRAMDAPEIVVRVDLGAGAGVGEAFGCDLTEEYVRENSEYST